MSRAVCAFAAVSLLAAGVWVRISNFAQVFVGGSVLPLTADANYHLYRSLRTFASFPHAPVFDPLMNWPQGANAHVADGYDVISALAALLLASKDDLSAAAVMVYVPVAFGLASAALTVAIAVQLADGDTALRRLTVWLALGLALFLPIGVFISVLGRTDHHCAEALLVAALCLWTLDRFPLARFRAFTRGRRLRFELAGGLAATFALYMFNGAPAYVAVFVPVLLAATLLDRGAPPAQAPLWLGSGAPALALAALGTAALYGVSAAQHGILFSYAFPSLLQPCLLLAAAAACAAAVLVARTFGFPPEARLPLRRVGALAGMGVAATLVLAALPQVRAPAIAALSEHLLRGDPYLQTVQEAQPLIRLSRLGEGQGWAMTLHYFGLFGPLSLVLLPFGLRRVSAAQRGRALAFAWAACWITVLTLVQNRFARGLFPLIAAWSALGAAALAIGLAARAQRARPQWRIERVGATLAIAGVAVLLAGADGVSGRVRPRSPAGADAPQLASLFLARHNPVRRDGTRAGALTPWSVGHHMMWPAKTGVVANGFLFHVGREALRRSERALGGREANAIAWMEQRDLGWLVVGASYYSRALAGQQRVRALVAGPHGAPTVNVAFLERVPMAVTMLGGGGVPDAGVSHLGQLSPRWAAPMPAADGPRVPTLWVFERVRGARLTGSSAPGARVHAETELRVRGQRLPYVAWATAGPDGRFGLRIPVWNAVRDESIATGPLFRVRATGGATTQVRVSESDVREGRELALQLDVGER